MSPTARTARRWAIFVRRVTDYSVPVWGLQHLKASATDLALATRPVKIMAACLSPKEASIESHMSVCPSKESPVLIVGDITAKYTGWNSMLITCRSSLVRDYANRKNCRMYGQDSPTTAPHTHKATTNVPYMWLSRI
jgi:hypothetical protein